MIIPWQALDSQTLRNVIEYFVLRQGTDYGWLEKTLAEKVADVMLQLQTEKAVIVWSEYDKTIDIKIC